MINLTNKERGEQFIRVTSVYIATIVLLGLAFFFRPQKNRQVQREQFYEALGAENEFESVLGDELVKIDSLSAQLTRYDANVHAAFLDNDIRSALDAIGGDYKRLRDGDQYALFDHAYTLYNTVYVNRRELGGNVKDIGRLKASCDECKRSTLQMRESLSRQSPK